MRRVLLLVLAAVAVVASGCGGDDGAVAWRDARMQLPEGWVVFDQEETRLSLANVPLGAEVEEMPEGDVVAVFLTHEVGAGPNDWREFAEASDIVVERDEAVEVGGVPATRLQLLDPAGGSGDTRTREMVVVVPSREVVLLAQPLPSLGDEDVTDVYDRAEASFEELLASIRWGAPVGGPGVTDAP